MNILCYTPLNTRCRDIESQAAAFQNQGHRVFLLTQTGRGDLHRNFEGYGYRAAGSRQRFSQTYVRLAYHALRLIFYCFRNKIDLVYSHLEPCNFVAVVTQYLIAGRVVICRHHVDEARLYGFDRDLSYRLTYRLTKDIIVVSNRAKAYMVDQEGVAESRIHFIPLAYDFKLYERPDAERVKQLRAAWDAELVLLTVCRLTKQKRPGLAVEVAKRLRDEGRRVKLIILGKGELADELQHEILTQGLATSVIMPGYVHNVLEYMAASDFLIHPSLLESSCITLKEAGLVKLPVIVCRGVGDFDDVIQDGVNGFLVNPDEFVLETARVVRASHHQPEVLRQMGAQLELTVRQRFDIQTTAQHYQKLFHHDRASR